MGKDLCETDVSTARTLKVCKMRKQKVDGKKSLFSHVEVKLWN
jgi:hypothetical protein